MSDHNVIICRGLLMIPKLTKKRIPIVYNHHDFSDHLLVYDYRTYNHAEQFWNIQ